MTFYDIQHKFNFLIDDYGYELVKLSRTDNKSEFDFVYFNKKTNRRVWVSYNGSQYLAIKIYKTSKPESIFDGIKIIRFKEYWISEFIEQISNGKVLKTDLNKGYNPQLYIKDNEEHAEYVTRIYQDVINTYLNDIITGKKWVNWKRKRKINNFLNLFSKNN